MRLLDVGDCVRGRIKCRVADCAWNHVGKRVWARVWDRVGDRVEGPRLGLDEDRDAIAVQNGRSGVFPFTRDSGEHVAVCQGRPNRRRAPPPAPRSH